MTATNTQGQTTGSAATKIVATGATSTAAITIFTVPNATQYNVYIGSGASQPADTAMWLRAGLSGANAQQPAISGTATLADGATVMPSGEVTPAYVTVTLTAPPATSGTALSSVASNSAKTFVAGSGNLLMWDGLIAQALGNASTANGATLGAQVAQPADPTGKLALSDIDNLLAGMYLQAAGDPDYMVVNYPVAKARGLHLPGFTATPSGCADDACVSQVPAHPYPVRIGRLVDCLGGAAPSNGFSPSSPDRSHQPLDGDSNRRSLTVQPSTPHGVSRRSSRYRA